MTKNKNKTYSISFDLQSNDDNKYLEEYPWLKTTNGIKGEIKGWLEDLRFDVIGLEIKVKNGVNNG